MRTPPPLVVLVLGGAAERWACPAAESPLAVAQTPNLDRLASEGRVFGVQLAENPLSVEPLLAILGIDPTPHETARASYLGAVSGAQLAPEECFLSADFVALFRDVLADAEPERMRPAESEVLLETAADEMIRAGFRLLLGEGTHHLAVALRVSVDASLPAPEQALGRKLGELEPGTAQHAFAHRLGRSALDGHEINEVRRDLGSNGADMIWVWGPGRHPRLENTFPYPASAFGTNPLWRAVCHVAALEVKALGAKTAAGMVRALAQALETDRVCFVYSRRGVRDALRRESGARAEGLAALDEKLVGPIAKVVARLGARLLVLSDAAWSTAEGAPLSDPVPALLWGDHIRALSPQGFHEQGAAAAGEPLAPGHGLLAYVQRF